MRLRVSSSTDVDKYIAGHHYLHSTPAGARVRLWVVDDKDVIIGAMMWGRPTARTYNPKRILELTRLYMVDNTAPFVESKAIAMARKYIRKHLPEIKGLISYSSEGEGHRGTVYEADGWFAVGTTKARAWNRAGRRNIDTSKKTRWVRSV